MVKVYKIMRTDFQDAPKLPLPMGHISIGRGKLLTCNDKRVSRHHGELQISDDGVVLKALSVNPCFYKTKKYEGVQLLHQYSTIKLEDGDKFGLVPESYWFQIICCEVTNNEIEESRKVDTELQLDEVKKYKDKSPAPAESEFLESNMHDNSSSAERAESPSLIPVEIQLSTNEDTVENYLSNSDLSKNEITSCVVSENELSNSEVKKNPVVTETIPTDCNTNSPFNGADDTNNELHSPNAKVKVEPDSPSSSGSVLNQNGDNKTSPKRSHDNEEEPEIGGMTIKLEPIDDEPGIDPDKPSSSDQSSVRLSNILKPSPKRSHEDEEEPEIGGMTIKLEPIDDEPGIDPDKPSSSNQCSVRLSNILKPSPKRSHDDDEEPQIGEKKIRLEPEDVEPVIDPVKPSTSDQSSTQTNNNNGQSPQKPTARERCIYGVNCYRKNPLHRAEFSHPGAEDWGSGDRGECPWGRTCRRRDPRHWLHHEHPPGTVQPGPRRPGVQHVERRGNNIYIMNAHVVNIHDDHFQLIDSDGESVDLDYEF